MSAPTSSSPRDTSAADSSGAAGHAEPSEPPSLSGSRALSAAGPVFGALPQLNDVTQPDENPTQWVHSQTKSKTISARLKAMIAKPFKSILPGRRNGEGSLRHTLEEI
ncbi:MAG: hypothetical protein AAF220_00800, partial [Pseudomonadota bacterium]